MRRSRYRVGGEPKVRGSSGDPIEDLGAEHGVGLAQVGEGGVVEPREAAGRAACPYPSSGGDQGTETCC